MHISCFNYFFLVDSKKKASDPGYTHQAQLQVLFVHVVRIFRKVYTTTFLL